MKTTLRNLTMAWPLAQCVLLFLLASAAIAHAAEPPQQPNPLTGWGDPVNGLSVRLSSEGPIWDFRQQGFFKFSVRNYSAETVWVAPTQIAGELEYDGIWYPWGTPTLATPMLLASGNEIDDIMVSVGGDWRRRCQTIDWFGLVTPQRPGRLALQLNATAALLPFANPEGVLSVSPGLRGTSYPGCPACEGTNPERVASFPPATRFGAGPRFNPYRVEGVLRPGTQGSSFLATLG